MPDSFRLRSTEKERPAWGVYISIPFCRFKCTYCNFASGVFRQPALERYLEALCWEIRQWDRHLCLSSPTADSMYLGGGTPSMLSAEQITRLFSELREAFQVAGGA